VIIKNLIITDQNLTLFSFTQPEFIDSGCSISLIRNRSALLQEQISAVMSDSPVKDILLIRKHPRFLNKASHRKKQWQSILSSKGATTHYAGHDITFVFLGYGKKLRRLHPAILDKLNAGTITDIVDIGGGGALDPRLQRGDLILSSEDILYDTLQPFKVRRRKGMPTVAQTLAHKEQRHFFKAKILTSAHTVVSKKERLALYTQTQCAIVQMEHCWFLQVLQKSIEPQAFSALHMTHLEIVADVVPQRDTWFHHAIEYFYGILYCLIRNEHYIGHVKSEFLKLWLNNEEGRTLGQR
jgi:purine-nucleoside phosphorylase